MVEIRMQILCLIVDDDPEEATRACQGLTSIVDKELKFQIPKGCPDFDLKFEPFCPNTDDNGTEESSDSFKARFVEHLVGDSNQSDYTYSSVEDRTLLVIVFDYMLRIGNPASSGAKGVDGAILANLTLDIRPNIWRVLLTAHSEDRITGTNRGLFNDSMHKDLISGRDPTPGLRLLLRKIVKGIVSKMATPYWDALHKFAVTDKIVMHAMAATDFKMAIDPGTTTDLVTFLGQNFFNAEASSTVEPLDSLLEPSGTLGESARLVADAFGADRAFFVTNGTSNSNRILHTALTRQKDYVLIDASCHISHHYSIASVGSYPVYLRPYKEMNSGSVGTIPTSQISQTLDSLIRSQIENGDTSAVKLPSLIALTNCTFDGIAVDPEKVFESVYQTLDFHNFGHRLREIAFLFDEAWFSFARFHPKYIRYSAISAAERFRKRREYSTSLRVYVTQSTHKTLFSMRQSSLILISDPVLSKRNHDKNEANLLSNRLIASFRGHTTTSPNSIMLASMDVARRQMSVEGKKLVDAAIVASGLFRESFENPVTDTDELISSAFAPLGRSHLIPPNLHNECFLDDTKVTLAAKFEVQGGTLKRELYKNVGIQINKYGKSSALFLFTPGFPSRFVADLKNRLAIFVTTNNRPFGDWSEFSPNFLIPDDTSFEDIQFMRRDGSVASYPDSFRNGEGLDLRYWLFGEGSDEMRTIVLKPSERSSKEQIVCGTFITPYPPGYPVFVPGQVCEIKQMFDLLDEGHPEIHGGTFRENEISIFARRIDE